MTDPEVEITVTWQTADGTTGSFPLQRFEDAGEYQYHIAAPQPLPAQPVRVTATSSLGGTTRPATPAAWPGATPPAPPAGYQKDFIDAYMTPVDIKARVARLARQYPDLVDVVDLPNKTQGYRRTATAYLGDPAAAAIVVESVKFGDQGPNGWQVRTVDPGRPNRPAQATWRDRVLTVSLATDAAGAVVSTTDQVAALIGARFPQRFSAFVEDGSAGKVMPVAGPGPDVRRPRRARRRAAQAVDRAGAADRRAPRRLADRRAGLLPGARAGVGDAARHAGVRRAAAGQLRDRRRRPGSCWRTSRCS